MNPVTGEHDTALGEWQPPSAEHARDKELLVAFDAGRAVRVLVLPAWFDEANRMRRFTLEVMRHLHQIGIDSLLPDLPGCNESLAALEEQTLARWREATEAFAAEYGATHVLAIRAGALVAPPALPGWRLAPQSGPKLLRAMIRARIIAAREAQRDETSEALSALGRREGIALGGWSIGSLMFGELEHAEPAPSPIQRDVAQSELGGSSLWLRAEPDEDPSQSLALAKLIAAETSAVA